MAVYPKISIITPTYNQGQYIEETICSVLSQNYPNLEYIVIDGGSTDNTVEVIKKYSDRITYWVSEADKGQTDAINKGFSKCTGEIFNWLNSDDYYSKYALHTVGETFSKNSTIKVVCGKEYGFYDSDRNNTIFHKGSIINKAVEETVFTGIIDQPCTFFRTNEIRPFFPLNTALQYVMDRQLWCNFLVKYGIGDVRQIDNILTYFRLHSASKSVTEGNKFEAEDAFLKLNLLTNLAAPKWLLNDMQQRAGSHFNKVPSINFPDIMAVNKKDLLNLFVYDFALRSYVREDLESARVAIQFIKKSGALKKEYLPLFVKAGLLSPSMIMSAKKIKKAFSWKNSR